MSDNIVNMFGDQLHDDTPEQFLEKVSSLEFESCVLIGQHPDGELFFGGNTGDMKNNLWLLMRAMWEMQRWEASLK